MISTCPQIKLTCESCVEVHGYQLLAFQKAIAIAQLKDDPSDFYYWADFASSCSSRHLFPLFWTSRHWEVWGQGGKAGSFWYILREGLKKGKSSVRPNFRWWWYTQQRRQREFQPLLFQFFHIATTTLHSDCQPKQWKRCMMVTSHVMIIWQNTHSINLRP